MSLLFIALLILVALTFSPGWALVVLVVVVLLALLG